MEVSLVSTTYFVVTLADFPSHSFRFEHKLGPRLKVTALIDPSIDRAQGVLEGKRASFVESAYRDTKVFKTVEDYHADLKKNNIKNPEYVSHYLLVVCRGH